MKLLLITLSALALTLSSCRKCAQCTTTVTTKTTGQMPTTGTSVTEMCGDDLKEADGNQTVSTATVNGFTSTITTKTTCQ